MSTATARKPVYQSNEAKKTLARLADRQAAVRKELEKLRADQARWDAARAREAAQTKAAVAAEVAKFEAFCRKHPMKMHKMQDASKKWWQCTDLTVLKRHIVERNRLISTPAYKSVMAAYEEGRRRGARYDPSYGWD
jgi:hypothetical protein